MSSFEEDPSDGNGIVASSSAFSKAELEQKAEQENENEANIEFPFDATPASPPPPPVIVEIPVNIIPVELGLQLEGVLQANLNLQAGVATAEAESGPVTVEQEGPLTAGLDGIDATSEAVAIADFEQEADQSNDDSKDITRTEQTDADGNPLEPPFQPGTIAAQGELVGQVNANVQLGLATADSDSGDVDVTSLDELTAGEDGINAESKAVAVADLDQKADQENEAEMSADESAAALQGQLVGQLNFNVQAGAAIASAQSGDVDVEQDGVLTAGAGGSTGDGITADSKAIAVAKLEQEADQKNETSATAELENPTRPVVIDVITPDRWPRHRTTSHLDHA